jgi:hypothetical protein
MTPHSELPWSVEKDFILDKKNNIVVDTCLSDMKFDEENKANASFIVRACNNHEKLVKAFKRLVERIDHNGGIGEYNGGPAFVMKEAREAIQSAEED